MVDHAQDMTGFDRLASALRPKLHRYCARMTGSAIDGEDVVQDALVKAIEGRAAAGELAHPEAWLFRIAHNTALDFLRRRGRRGEVGLDEGLDLIVDPVAAADDREIARAGLHHFMHLPPAQRSSVILMDVLGYSLAEIAAMTETGIPAVKAALHRGRTRLRQLLQQADEIPPPAMTARERQLLVRYADRFNARDFDALRDMLAEEVRLDLVGRLRRAGRRDVSGYFSNYSTQSDWHLVPGLVEGHPALLVYDPQGPAADVQYFVLLQWEDDRITAIRDFRYARHVTGETRPVPLP